MAATDNSEKEKTNKVSPIQTPAMSEVKPTLSVDVDYYQDIIDDPDVSDERKRELIEFVGNIVMQFIDLGFGVHTVQLAQDEQQQSAKEKLLEGSDL